MIWTGRSTSNYNSTVSTVGTLLGTTPSDQNIGKVFSYGSDGYRCLVGFHSEDTISSIGQGRSILVPAGTMFVQFGIPNNDD
jgi:hypothetical protein